MLPVEVLRPKREVQLFPGSRIIDDSMKTISLSRPGSHLVECVLVAHATKAISNGFDIVVRGSERVRYQGRGRRPRCPHGYRLNDANRHCDCGIIKPTSLVSISSKTPQMQNIASKPSGLYNFFIKH